MNQLLRTPLYELQAPAGARFVPFAGYELPVQFTSIVAEHQAVRTRVGLFDVSHMGEARIQGPAAKKAVQYLITNDVERLSPGKALYTVMCLPTGGIVDDFIVYQESEQEFFCCLNAARKDADILHMRQVLANFACEITDVSAAYAQLALQGPLAAEVLASWLTQQATPAALSLASEVASLRLFPLFTFRDLDLTLAASAKHERVRIARTGYTGEDGFELYMSPALAPFIYKSLQTVGAPLGLVLCGLGARDSLRLEMKYPLYGHEIDLEHHPLEANLGFVVKLHKGADFVGREALLAVKDPAKRERRLVSFKALARGPILREGYTLHSNPHDLAGSCIGQITSGGYSPHLQTSIGLGYVASRFSADGTLLYAAIRQQAIALQVVTTPFYEKAS